MGGADTILVTGGAGYVGSHVCRKLLGRGYRVRVLDSFLYGDKGLADIRESADLELLYGDICDVGDVRNSVRGCKGVIALAALVGDAACDIDPEEAIAVNFRSSKILMDECKRAGVERLVFASSCSVYGPTARTSSPRTRRCIRCRCMRARASCPRSCCSTSAAMST
jgi:nucleoside-diphosphate-sugar epimerase